MDNKRLHSIPGFKPANVATMYLHLPGIRYPQIPSRRIFGRNCSRELMPSWAEAAMTRDLLPVGTYVYHRVLIDGQPTPGGESEPEVQTLSVRGNYFSAMNIPIRARR